MHASTYALGVPSEYPESSGLDGRESSTMPLQYHFFYNIRSVKRTPSRIHK